MSSAWQRRRSEAPSAKPDLPANSMTEEEILAAPEEHSRVVHGDDRFHSECAECRELGREMMALFGFTPQQYLDSFGWLDRGDQHNMLYNIATACAEEDGDGE